MTPIIINGKPSLYLQRASDQIPVWLVLSESSYDIGMTFIRAQEYYESSEPEFKGKHFNIYQYMRWYANTQSELKTFTYTDDWRGFNIPSTVAEEIAYQYREDQMLHDFKFTEIVKAIKEVDSEYYIIGAKTGDCGVMNHEFAHAMWALSRDYRDAMEYLLKYELSRMIRSLLEASLMKDGYAESVIDDEMHAYLATGLSDEMKILEPIRREFVKVFDEYKSRLIKPSINF